jgi:hypothetical protein
MVAKAHGALSVVEFSRDMGLQSIILEDESLQVVKALTTQNQNWSKYGQILDDTKGVLNLLRNWQIQHT